MKVIGENAPKGPNGVLEYAYPECELRNMAAVSDSVEGGHMQIKKTAAILGAGVLTLGLVACGDSSDNADGPDGASNGDMSGGCLLYTSPSPRDS